jgi:pyruvate formate-lyase/glycerol dehydratase family glycyl radical enzyme
MATAAEKIKSLADVGYDEDSWGVGISGVVEDPSPFPRINRLRNWYWDESPWTLDAERAVLYTEAFKQNESEPKPIQLAQAFAHVLRNVTLHIVEGQLLVGDSGAPPKSCPIYPEFSYEWLINELTGTGVPEIRERPDNIYIYDDETRDALLGLAEYWKGKTLSDHMLARMSPDEMKGDFMGIMLYSTSLYHFAGVGHLVFDYELVLNKGWKAMRQEVQALHDAVGDDEVDRRIHYQAGLIAIDAVIDYIKRYGALARERADSASGGRRDELLQMAENLEWIAENPPRSFWQAFQLLHLTYSINQIEANGHSVSLGRLDQILYPYFQKDLDAGTASREFIQELLECHAVITACFMKLRDWLTTKANSGRFLATNTVSLGGVDAEGRDATNELSGMFLDMVAHTRLGNPWTAVRVHDDSPDWFMKKTAKAMRMGTGEPKCFSDTMIIPAMIKSGISEEDARNYVIVGCVELSVPGKEYGWHDSAYFSIARVLELALNDGFALGKEELGRLGPATGSLAEFQTFEEVKRAYETQMEYWVQMMVQGTNIMDEVHRELKPLPYVSLLVQDCTENGVDINAGGAHYNFTGPQAAGVGTTADGLSVIKQLVFEEKKVSGQQLLDALKANWEGHDVLYHLVNSEKMHHYGNDDDYADELATYACDVYCEEVEKHTNPRGGKYIPGVYTVSANVPFGQVQAASPDGRKNFEPLSDCLGPVHTFVSSHDRKGPTAVIKSAGKLNQGRMANGTLLNLKFSPTSVSGETGAENVVSLIRAYFKRGMHVQLNVIGREMLQDAYDHPEKYRGLMIRVAGYSAAWADLSDALRLDILNRTEMSFD